MIIYESKSGKVENGFLRGIRISTPHRSRQRPPFWLKERMPIIHKGLLERGHNIMTQPSAATAYWEYIIDLMNSPMNGLHHRAEASTPISETVDYLTTQI